MPTAAQTLKLGATALLLLSLPLALLHCGDDDDGGNANPGGHAGSAGASGGAGASGSGGNGLPPLKVDQVGDSSARLPFDAAPDPDGAAIYLVGEASDGQTSSGGVFKIDVAANKQTMLASGHPLAAPTGIAVSDDGKTLFIADPIASASDTDDSGRIFSLPAAGGTPTPLTGGDSKRARSLTVSGDKLYFSGFTAVGSPGVYSLPTAGGTATPLLEGGALSDPVGIAVSKAGDVFVLDSAADKGKGAVLFKIANNTATPVVKGFLVGFPAGVALSLDDTVAYVSALHPATGNTSVVLAITLADGSFSATEEGLKAYQEPAGLHRAKNKEIFALADSHAENRGRIFLLQKLPMEASGGPYPRRAGNAVTPWIDGVPFYERLLEAVRGARSSVWAIVSFIEPSFCFPDGTAWWDLLDECVERGVDVRVLFWRNPRFKTDHVFSGGSADRALLRQRGARWAARWDSSGDDPGHCHHQKGFVLDAGLDDAIAFVGGMVLSRSTLARPGHRQGHQKHDAFVELRGPVVHDAIANFVQRWNLARVDPEAPPWPDAQAAGPLALPERPPPPRGAVDAQLARTIRAGDYGSAGEARIREQYLAAFAAAERTIYIENQHPGELLLLAALDEALRRGVRVAMVVPAEPMGAIVRASREVAALGARAHEHRYGATFLRLAALAQHERFTLAALARSDPAPGGGWTHRQIYVHAKLCVVDGAWATIGSANLVDLSMAPDHTELNASFWGEATCWPLLRGLVAEHTGVEAADDVGALAALAAAARSAQASLAAGGPIEGCYALDPGRYGQDERAR